MASAVALLDMALLIPHIFHKALQTNIRTEKRCWVWNKILLYPMWPKHNGCEAMIAVFYKSVPDHEGDKL